jgi:hypothetical protein
VRAALLLLPGMLAVSYQPEADYFTVGFESVLVSLETIFATVVITGKQMGQEYLPEFIPA